MVSKINSVLKGLITSTCIVAGVNLHAHVIITCLHSKTAVETKHMLNLFVYFT